MGGWGVSRARRVRCGAPTLQHVARTGVRLRAPSRAAEGGFLGNRVVGGGVQRMGGWV